MVRSSSAKHAPAKNLGARSFTRGFDLDLGLFSFGGPFAGYSDPALVVGPNGVILAANEAAGELAALLKGGISPELRTAIETALDGHTAQVNPLLLSDDGAEELTRALDVIALPWGEGAAVLLLGRDITLERNLRRTLVGAYERYKDIVGLLAEDFAWEVDSKGVFVFVSPQGALGYDAEQIIGTAVADHVGEGDCVDAFAAREPVRSRTVTLRHADGTGMEMDLSVMPLWNGDGEWIGARGLCRSR